MDKSVPKMFKNVWYRPDEAGRRELMNAQAFTDRGTLVLEQGSLVFTGKNHTVRIIAANRIVFGKLKRGLFNNWVKIDYNQSTAFFMDGKWLGWHGLLGGTKKLYSAIQKALELGSAL
ncbi:MAG: hypothetical protein ABSD57_11915 [Verrucomicrobiota bacterium]|jgi:hypothetical protein